VGSPSASIWHFLLACRDNPYLLSVCKQLWEASNGWMKIERYNREHSAGYYINKLISEARFPTSTTFDKLHYTGPADLLEATRSSPYFPNSSAARTTGEYLAVRPRSDI